jgi:hypothetical protein
VLNEYAGSWGQSYKTCGMRLTLFPKKDNLLPGYIVLRFSDPKHSYVAGSFHATILRSPSNVRK